MLRCTTCRPACHPRSAAPLPRHHTHHCCCCSNLTLTGLPGQSPLLDLRFKASVAELCDSCRLTLSNMTITHERMGANALLDFFIGSGGGSVVSLVNVVRKRMSCTPIGAP